MGGKTVKMKAVLAGSDNDLKPPEPGTLLVAKAINRIDIRCRYGSLNTFHSISTPVLFSIFDQKNQKSS